MLQIATFGPKMDQKRHLFAILNMLKNRHFFGGKLPQIVDRLNALKTATLAQNRHFWRPWLPNTVQNAKMAHLFLNWPTLPSYPANDCHICQLKTAPKGGPIWKLAGHFSILYGINRKWWNLLRKAYNSQFMFWTILNRLSCTSSNWKIRNT